MMTTKNPYDDLNKTVIRRAKKIDRHLNDAIEIVRKYDLVPRLEPMEFKAFIDERGKPVYISESEHPVEFNRRGKWVKVREVLE